MTKQQFQKWRKNGNLKFESQETYLSLLNDLSENMPLSKNKLRELANYLSLENIELNNEHQSLKLKILSFALENK